MMLIAVFLLLSLLYSLFSSRLRHTVLTAPVAFTSAGVVVTLLLPGDPASEAHRPSLLMVAEAALVLLLFSDASRADLRILRSVGAVPTRLLSVGMLLTILLGTLAALLLFPSLTIWEAAILGAILAPTDAGLGETIVSSPRVPVSIRQALNAEAGLNDGLAVPFMLLFITLAQVSGAGPAMLLRYGWEQIGLGCIIGVLVGGAGGVLLGVAHRKGWMEEPLSGLGLVTLPALCAIFAEAMHASMFIAAFVAGMAVQGGLRDAGRQSLEFTRSWGEWLNWFVFFLFGFFIVSFWDGLRLQHVLYAVLSLTVVRLLPVALALLGSGLSPATVGFIGWFGPRGLASIVLGMVYMETQSNLPGEATIRLTVMVTVMVSIYAHGLTAIPGIELYLKRIAGLSASAPEHRGAPGWAQALH